MPRLPHPATRRSFERSMSREEFSIHYGAEMELLQRLKSEGKDVAALEQELANIKQRHDAGQKVPKLDLDRLVAAGSGPHLDIPDRIVDGGQVMPPRGNAHNLHMDSLRRGQDQDDD